MLDTIVVEEKDGVKKVAGLCDGRLDELVICDYTKQNEGNIYLGKIIKKLATANGKKGYFVNVGDGSVFINASEFGLEDLEANEGQDIILQIIQEARAEKDAKGSRFLQLAGRNVVFCPYGDRIDISNRIQDEEKRQELFDLLANNVEDGGWVVRTHAKDVQSQDILTEIKTLQDVFQDIMVKAKALKSPTELWKRDNLIEDMILRNSDNLQKVIVNSHLEEENLKSLGRIEYCRDPWKEYGIEEQLVEALQKEVKLKDGGRIFIEETKALVAIDVDSGEGYYQGGITKLNDEAAKEIARQIILRNLSGKIVIDFAGLGEYHFLKSSIDILHKCLYNDVAKSRVLGVTKAGNVEILRNRRRPSLSDLLMKNCDICNGLGRVEK